MRFNVVEKNIAALIGLPIETIRMYSPSELRLYLEKKNKRKFSFTTEFPVIGRGNVLRDNIITSEEINRDIDKILTHSK
jgi:formate-dependent phosphoribosylglycinamide formyltransferase (GAR transformylase)